MTTKWDAIENGRRIHAACFSECDTDVSFYDLGGSIVRVAYNRRTTITTTEFIPVDSWEYDALRRMG